MEIVFDKTFYSTDFDWEKILSRVQIRRFQKIEHVVGNVIKQNNMAARH